MDKDTSEIAKLTERISKDPKSKLFVPLAEEYKKAGDIEMSIHVLTEGLINNPGYVTARSFLGKLLFEKGDLPGAQKEFEEVVKAIPDNLMAQRKLGDLYVLQDRPTDALKRYKIVLSLNPKDQDTASLIAEAEAGHDIKSRIPRPKPQVPESASQNQEPPQAGPAPAAPKPHSSPVTARPAATGSIPAVPAEHEEPEEVLVVEPLEPVVSPTGLEHALAAQHLDFLAEPGREAALPDAGADTGESVFSSPQPVAAQQKFGGPERGEASPPAEEPEKTADDFTTDTLAELYISQGFFEKAVDIYERMLVDNPNSQGLKNKLANVRALAAEAAPAVELKGNAKLSAAPEAGPAPADMPAADMAPGIMDEFVPPPAEKGDLLQSDDEWSSPATSRERTKKAPSSEPASTQPAPLDAGFEPLEYVPPGAAPAQGSEGTLDRTPSGKTERNASPPRKSSTSGRKETIDRLENWLQHIMKEK
jgi:tetratricopeptide (TPR) repeat protein